jgi:hypothetical protein
MFAIIALVMLCSFALFGLLKKLGLFRIDKEIEIIGVDIAELGGVDEEVYAKLRQQDFVSRAVSVISSTASPYLLPH